MAIGYTWDCKTCDTYPTKSSKSNVVHNVHWRLTATDDTNKDSNGHNWTASCYGTQALDTSDLSSFKNWSSLTNSDVQAWVEAALGSDTVTNMKASLDANIAEKVTPTSVQKTLSS
tara:strand:- start:665 stop:1012 length:348 start_codon:yes stop_codon:yes gene_type:complete